MSPGRTWASVSPPFSSAWRRWRSCSACCRSGLLSLVGGPGLPSSCSALVSGAVVGTIAAMLLWGFTGGAILAHHTHLQVPLRGLAAEHRGSASSRPPTCTSETAWRAASHPAGRARQRHRSRPDRGHRRPVRLRPAPWNDGPPAGGAPRATRRVRGPRQPRHLHRGRESPTASARTRRLPAAARRSGAAPISAPLYIAGLDDPRGVWTGRGVDIPELQALAADLPCDGPTVLLVHRPELFPQAARLGFPLVLAGHTHGGQLALPTVGGRLNLARLMTRYPRALPRERLGPLREPRCRRRRPCRARQLYARNHHHRAGLTRLDRRFDTGVSAFVDSNPSTPFKDVRGASGEADPWVKSERPSSFASGTSR